LVVATAVIFLNDRQSMQLPVEDCPPDGGPVGDVETPVPTRSTVVLPSPTVTTEPTRTPTSPPSATPAPAITTLSLLQQRMELAIATNPVGGSYAVAVTDLQTGETVSVNGDRKQLSACAINLFVLLQVTIDMQEGKYDSDTVEAIDDLISATTWSSNAATARDLYAIAGNGDVLTGVTRVDSLMQTRLGLTSSVLDHPPLYAEHSLGRGDNWLTANEANKALVALWQGDLLTQVWRNYLLNRLANVKPGLNYLTGLLSNRGAVVSQKNGFFEYSEGFVDNDLGIVLFAGEDQEAAFAITFLSEGVPTKYADVQLGQRLVEFAFEYFSITYN
jgi:hypothetical protein